jgi:hypothetical protein
MDQPLTASTVPAPPGDEEHEPDRRRPTRGNPLATAFPAVPEGILPLSLAPDRRSRYQNLLATCSDDQSALLALRERRTLLRLG